MGISRRNVDHPSLGLSREKRREEPCLERSRAQGKRSMVGDGQLEGSVVAVKAKAGDSFDPKDTRGTSRAQWSVSCVQGVVDTDKEEKLTDLLVFESRALVIRWPESECPSL